MVAMWLVDGNSKSWYFIVAYQSFEEIKQKSY